MPRRGVVAIQTASLFIVLVGLAFAVTLIDGVDGSAGVILGYVYGSLAGNLAVLYGISKGLTS